MANNRMYLVHEVSGQRVCLAKHYADAWRPFDEWNNPNIPLLAERLRLAFEAEAADGSSIGSTGWRIEYEHHSKHDDPLMPSTTETWQDADGKWHLGDRPR